MIDAEIGDAAATAEAFARAAHVTRLDTWINRVTGVPMEPRAAVGIYDAATGRYTLYAGSGGIVRQKKELSAILGVPFESVRVIAREIGGNFGTRNSFFPEFAMVAWGSRAHRAAGEMDLPNAMRPLSATIWAAILRCRPNSRSMPTAVSWRYAAPISAMSAPIAVLTCRWSKASG